MEQSLKLWIACRRNAAHRRVGESLAGKHDPIEPVPAKDCSACRVNYSSLGWIIKGGIEFCYVAPQAVPRRAKRIPPPKLESQIVANLATVLHEKVRSQSAPWRI